MGSQNKVLQASEVLAPDIEVVGEVVTVSGGLGGEYIKSSTSDLAGAAGLDESGNVDDATTAGVDKVRTSLHLLELSGGDHVASLGEIGDVEGDKVGLAQKLLKSRDLAGGTKSHQGNDIVVDDVHTHSLSEDRQLRTNVTVADNSQSLASNLPALGADLVPGTTVHLVGSVAELTGKGDDLGNDKLSDTARVGEGGVEDGDTILGGKLEVDLVGTNTEAADDEEVCGLTEDLLGELCLGSDTNDLDVAVGNNLSAYVVGYVAHERGAFVRSTMEGHRFVEKKSRTMAGYFANIPNLLNELVLRKRGLESLDLVALGLQNFLSSDIDILEK